MKKMSRFKNAAPIILLGLLLGDSPVNQRAEALVGGPFDDNSPTGVNADGTYSATLSGVNLIGMVSFGISSAQETTGRFSVFHEGFVHYGAAAGIVDLQSRRIAGSLLGVAPLTGDAFGGGIVETVGGSGNLTSGVLQTITARSSVEGAFFARMKGYPQRINFEGEGQLSSTANNAVFTSRVQATSPNGVDSFVTTVTIPATPQTLTDPASTRDGDIGGQLQAAQLRTASPFKVRGSRTSRTVFTSTFNYSALAPARQIVGTPTPVATP